VGAGASLPGEPPALTFLLLTSLRWAGSPAPPKSPLSASRFLSWFSETTGPETPMPGRVSRTLREPSGKGGTRRPHKQNDSSRCGSWVRGL